MDAQYTASHISWSIRTQSSLRGTRSLLSSSFWIRSYSTTPLTRKLLRRRQNCNVQTESSTTTNTSAYAVCYVIPFSYRFILRLLGAPTDITVLELNREFHFDYQRYINYNTHCKMMQFIELSTSHRFSFTKSPSPLSILNNSPCRHTLATGFTCITSS